MALKAELEDCAFPYVSSNRAFVILHSGIEFFTDPLDAFRDADIVFFLASLPLTGPDRASLLEKNINIYIEFGKALEQVASRTCKSIVVANPANTLAYVLMQTAPSLPRSNFAALNRTDHNRARSLTLDACRKACTLYSLVLSRRRVLAALRPLRHLRLGKPRKHHVHRPHPRENPWDPTAGGRSGPRAVGENAAGAGGAARLGFDGAARRRVERPVGGASERGRGSRLVFGHERRWKRGNWR